MTGSPSASPSERGRPSGPAPYVSPPSALANRPRSPPEPWSRGTSPPTLSWPGSRPGRRAGWARPGTRSSRTAAAAGSARRPAGATTKSTGNCCPRKWAEGRRGHAGQQQGNPGRHTGGPHGSRTGAGADPRKGGRRSRTAAARSARRSTSTTCTISAPAAAGQAPCTQTRPAPWTGSTCLTVRPLVSQSQRLTGHRWPRLAGSDLASPLLARAEQLGLRVGFLGGSEANQQLLAQKIATEHPGLQLVGMWCPRPRGTGLHHGIRTDCPRRFPERACRSSTSGLGKPRQELWIDRYAALTGAAVLLAFGAAVDFLAGRVQRAPEWFCEHGLEWGYRLALEPKRLAGRYLVDGPPAYLKLRTTSCCVPPARPDSPTTADPAPRTPGHFTGPDGAVGRRRDRCDVQQRGLPGRFDREPAGRNHRPDAARRGGRQLLERRDPGVRAQPAPDVLAFATGGNPGLLRRNQRGHAKGWRCRDRCGAEPRPHCGTRLPGVDDAAAAASQAGAVVPRLLNPERPDKPVLYGEPTIPTAAGGCLLGRRAPNRPDWLSGTDLNPESYAHPHTVDWATGAALMVRRPLADSVPWDESYFLYCEETDFFRQPAHHGGNRLVRTCGGHEPCRRSVRQFAPAECAPGRQPCPLHPQIPFRGLLGSVPRGRGIL